MAKIKLLSEDMIGKIAAGEVVERPAAAIKELVENSLDAGATAVTVEIREGGLNSIRVADNGCGIDESDIRLAFERHATSKISREQELNSIATLGFRGEALASIAAVSKVTMVTRTAGRETGLKVVNEGGRIVSVSEAAVPTGTTVTVKDLFYNVPVRKGFMKKTHQEATAVHELMIQLMLSRPDVSFRYISDGKTEYHTPGDGQAITAVQTIYGSRSSRAMRSVDDRLNGVIITGFVGIGENARGNRNHELFFINGRVMHSRMLNEAVETATRERVMIGRFPTCALYLTIAYEAVDVNVHPNKLEVRFRDEKGVYEAVLSAVLMALKDKDAFERPVEMHLSPEPKTGIKVPASAETAGKAEPAGRTAIRTGNTVEISKVLPPEAALPSHPGPLPYPAADGERLPGFRESSVSDAEPEWRPGAGTLSPKTVADVPGSVPQKAVLREECEQVSTMLESEKKPMKIFGALFNTFILVEYEDQLLMIDQHAVHERLLFDGLMQEHAKGNACGQELLVPIVIGVTKHEQRLLEENRESLESIGMVVEAFGEKDVAIRTIPMILGETQAKDFVRDVISELETGRNPTFEKKRSTLLQTACKHAVKGGEALPEEVIRDLLDQMIENKITPTCPHGRPLVVSVSHRELDRKFKRIQN